MQMHISIIQNIQCYCQVYKSLPRCLYLTINYIIYVHILYISVCIKSLAGIRPANASIKQKPSLKKINNQTKLNQVANNK